MRAAFVPSAETVNGIVYALAVHAQSFDVLVHGFAFAGPRYHILFTAPSAAKRVEFLESVARDAAGYLAEALGFERCWFELEDAVALDDPESQRNAVRWLTAEVQRRSALSGASS